MLWSRLVLSGAAVVCLVMTLLAILLVETGSDLWGIGFVLYVVFPPILAGFTAGDLASSRDDRFAEAVFTTPVPRRTFMLTKLAANLLVGLAYLVVTLPLVGLVAYHLGGQAVLVDFALAGVGTVLVAIATGALVGSLLGFQGVAAAAGGAVAVNVLYALAVPFARVVLAGSTGGLGPTVARLSPTLDVLLAAGLFPGVDSGALSLAGLVVFLAGLCAIAVWVTVRGQGPLGWRAAPARAIVVGVACLAVMVVPGVLADVSYHDDTGDASAVFVYDNADLSVAFAPPGTAPSAARFDHFRSSDEPALPAGEPSRLDLLVLLPVAPSATISRIDVALAPVSGALLVSNGGRFHLESPSTTPQPLGGTSGRIGQVARIPLTVTPVSPTALVHSNYVVSIQVSYEAEGKTLSGSAVRTLLADVSGIGTQVALAGSPAVLMFASAAVLRHRRT